MTVPGNLVLDWRRSAMWHILLAACVFLGEATYPPPKVGKSCKKYFGKETEALISTPIHEKLVTVVDLDLPKAFCNDKLPCTLVHHFGPKSACIPPTPPDKCHRYAKVTYEKCDKLLSDKAQEYAATIDMEDHFDKTGVLKSCRHHVKKQEMLCWKPNKFVTRKPHPDFPDSYDVVRVDCDKDCDEEMEKDEDKRSREKKGTDEEKEKDERKDKNDDKKGRESKAKDETEKKDEKDKDEEKKRKESKRQDEEEKYDANTGLGSYNPSSGLPTYAIPLFAAFLFAVGGIAFARYQRRGGHGSSAREGCDSEGLE